MTAPYDHRSIEATWQQVWQSKKVFAVPASPTGEHQYVLDMFPYPSGDGLHVGHPEGYTATDIFSRYLRMKGVQVLHPMGWDAFGLPAENAAIQKKTHPRTIVEQNVKNFKRQIQSIGFSYAWDREVNTTDPEYYKWTQWIFLQLFKQGLAYEKAAPIWWCPKDKTGLANEEVVDGRCDRCGTPVEKKMLKQWMLKITAYAERLLEGLEKLDWPESIKALQRNWIGRSEGAEVEFLLPIEEQRSSDIGEKHLKFIPRWIPAILSQSKAITFRRSDKGLKKGDFFKLINNDTGAPFGIAEVLEVKKSKLRDIPLNYPGQEQYSSNEERRAKWTEFHQSIVTDEDTFWIYRYRLVERIATVFTTRPDTLFGATYMVLSPEHPLVDAITTAEQQNAVEEYKKDVAAKSDLERTALEKDKTGVFTGAYAINPVNNEKIPVWIADYVLMSYGTGAIMAVPAHDERDYEFAKKFDLPIREVVAQVIEDELPDSNERQSVRAVVRHKGKILVTFDIPMKEFILPGGGVETGETPSQAIIREIREETGLTDLKIVKQLKSVVRHYYHRKMKNNWRSHVIGFIIDVQSDTAVERDPEEEEKTELHWMSVDEARKKLRNEGPTFGVEALFMDPDRAGSPFVGEGALINSGQFGGAPSKEASKKIVTWLEKRGQAKSKINYKLRDWVFSRQRYWGEPIPLIHCDNCGVVPVPEKDLPVLLPDVEKYEPTGSGESPLANITDWVNVGCPECDRPAKREANTMPQWAGSCWYYLRFTDPRNNKEFASKKAMKAWLPVDLYVGGAEHAVLHLLYARFWHKVLYDMGHIPPEVGDEPFAKLKNQGLILGPDGEKMSKSRGNVINPDEIIEKHGADTLRMYEMFMGPFEDAKPWDTNGIIGVRRFLDRVWRAAERVVGSKAPDRQHKYTKLITDGIENFRFNTCVSDLMKWMNEIGTEKVSKDEFSVFLRLLSPFAPHITEELWAGLGNTTLLAEEEWPKFDPKKVSEETVTIAVQVIGKLRATLTMESGVSQAEVEKAAQAEPNVAKYLTEKPKKVIFVQDRLINFVV